LSYLDTLQDALQTLYTQFARYPLKPVIAGCPHCVSGDDNDQLHVRPLRQLTPHDFRRYAFKALTTWGDADDFRHFLPRLLELIAFDDFKSLVNAEIVTDKLRYAQWQQWDKHEVRAVRDYFIALWKYYLGETPVGVEEPYNYPDAPIGDWLCIIAQAEDDLLPFLTIWHEINSLSSVLHLVQWINRNYFLNGSVTNLGNAFWNGRSMQHAQITEWLLRRETVVYLETFFYENPQADYAHAIALAIDNLENQRAG
jgi:hypothetical protein